MRWPTLISLLFALPSPVLAATTTAEQPADKMICKRQLETGTLAKFTKTCLSKAEWQRLRDKSQAIGQGLRDRNYSSCGSSNVATRPSEMGPAC
jgi:hypothetical protein